MNDQDSNSRTRSGHTTGPPTIPGTPTGFPHTPSELSTNWLTTVLREAGIPKTSDVTSIDVLPTRPGFGAMCNTVRIQLQYSNSTATTPKSLFAKFTTDKAMSVRATEREVSFYRDIAPLLDIRVPRCFFAGTTENSCLLLLEDIVDGLPGDSLAGCSTETATTIVGNIAQFHAQWWENPILGKWDWLQSSRDPSIPEGRFRKAWPVFKARYGDRLNRKVVVTGDRALEGFPELFRAITGTPKTLVHGDLQLDNLRTESPDAPLVFFDWANTRHGQGVDDIAAFLSRSMPAEQRRREGERLMQQYHHTLAESGVRDYPMKSLYRDLKYRLLFQLLVLAAASVGADYSSERGGRAFDAFVECRAAAIEDYGADEVLGS